MIRRQSQQVGHCGPTCISMLLEAHGESHTQHAIAAAAGVAETIRDAGSRIDQLAQAVDSLASGYILLGKFRSTLEDLVRLTEEFQVAVGVEWQGRFQSSSGNFDIGHFSLVVKIDVERHRVELVDPDDASFFQSAALSTEEFKRRWWEDNELEPGQKSRSWGLSFLVAPAAEEACFYTLGYSPVTLALVRDSSVDL